LSISKSSIQFIACGMNFLSVRSLYPAVTLGPLYRNRYLIMMTSKLLLCIQSCLAVRVSELVSFLLRLISCKHHTRWCDQPCVGRQIILRFSKTQRYRQLGDNECFPQPSLNVRRHSPQLCQPCNARMICQKFTRCLTRCTRSESTTSITR